MKGLLSISLSLIVVSLIFVVNAYDAAGQRVENAPQISAGAVVEKRAFRIDPGSRTSNPTRKDRIGERDYADASIFNFTSTELRQISGRYAAEGSNVHSQAWREYWYKMNARIESQRAKVLIP